jgi:hypothetical protein
MSLVAVPFRFLNQAGAYPLPHFGSGGFRKRNQEKFFQRDRRGLTHEAVQTTLNYCRRLAGARTRDYQHVAAGGNRFFLGASETH